jgi:hypothetical protein
MVIDSDKMVSGVGGSTIAGYLWEYDDYEWHCFKESDFSHDGGCCSKV